jgi:hypothetical protein
LDEREGYVEYVVRQETEDLANDTRKAHNTSSLKEVQARANSILSDVSSAISDMESYHRLLYSGTDRIGFLALTDLSRTSLRQQITNHLYAGKVNIWGDVFSNISNTTIINRSHLEASFNKLMRDGDTYSAEALKRTAEEIHKSGNKEAGELFDAFNEQLEKPTPKKSLLANSWKGLTETLPTILKESDVTFTITKLIDTFS